MTFAKLLGLGFVLACVLALLKVLFFSIFANNIALEYTSWLVIAIFTVAFVRRVGVINYLEAFLIMGVWWFFVLLLDLLLTGFLVGYNIFLGRQLWVGYAVLLLVVFLFHKKRHVEIRKQLRQ